MSRASIVMAALLFGVILSGPAWARKVAPIAYRCPEETKRQIDWEERRDVCLESSQAECPDGAALHEDNSEEADQCVVEQAQAQETATTPACPEEFKLHVRSGPDPCVRRVEHPKCRKGFRIRVLPGEDMCVR